jgi:hypothetical protein
MGVSRRSALRVFVVLLIFTSSILIVNAGNLKVKAYYTNSPGFNSNVEIYLDGTGWLNDKGRTSCQNNPYCSQPYLITWVTPGPHTVYASFSGFKGRKTVNAGWGDQDVIVRMVNMPGSEWPNWDT